MASGGSVMKNGEMAPFGKVRVENATGMGIEVRTLQDGTIEITRCCIRPPK